MTKKTLYTLLPILIILLIDGCDGWNGWKTLNLDFRRDKAEAEIVENPFYSLIKSGFAVNQFDEIDYDVLFDSASKSGKKYIKFRYFDDEKREFIDSIRYIYYVEYGGNKEEGSFYSEEAYQYSIFAEEIIDKSKGYKFDVYYFGNKTIPVSVYKGILSQTGNVRIYFQNSYLLLLIFAIIISIALGISQFKSNNKAN